MYKKIVTGLIFSLISFSINANTFSKSNVEIVTLAKKYEIKAENLAEIQSETKCFEYLSNGAEFLSYISSMIDHEREHVKQIAKYARDNIHAATLNNCNSLEDIRVLDGEIKDLILDF